jgi:sortase A
MNNAKLTKRKISKVSMLSLGLLILGIGFISWSLFHILLQSVPSSPTEIISPKIELASQQNASIDEIITVPEQFSTASMVINKDEILYPVRPEEGDTIGTLTIPALDQELPIIHGAGEDELDKGIGHFAQSVLPGENNNSVLSGHRDTVFRDLGELQIGDQLIVHTSAGTFTYEINNTQIVDKDDKTIITPTDHAVLTVTTCYPFVYVGAAPDRYILSADLVQRE